MPLKAVIFDRDGTLNDGSGYYVTHHEQLVLLPGVKEALHLLSANNIKIFVWTQQSCIGKGLLTEEGLQEIHTHMQNLLSPAKIEGFYHCPHTEEDNCTCRKPKAGLLEDILAEHGLNPHEVSVVGDSERDAAAAQTAGLEFYYVRSSKTPKDAKRVVDNLLELVRGMV